MVGLGIHAKIGTLKQYDVNMGILGRVQPMSCETPLDDALLKDKHSEHALSKLESSQPDLKSPLSICIQFFVRKFYLIQAGYELQIFRYSANVVKAETSKVGHATI